MATANSRNLVGQVFGCWTILRRTPHKRCLCRCSCGTVKEVITGSLVSGKSKSCGCLKAVKFLARITHHGQHRTPTYTSWQGMKARCLNPKASGFKDYGGRGITVCQRWLDSFEDFAADMGPRPHGTSIERIDNSKGYEPGNCRWATRKEQQRNRSGNRLITHNGLALPLADWAERHGLTWQTLASRLNAGWPVERALQTPPRSR